FTMRRLNIKQCLIFSIISILFLNLLVFNILLYYGYSRMSTSLTGNSWLENILSSPQIQKLIQNGKAGGFVNLQQNSLGRIFIMTSNKITNTKLDNLTTQAGKSAPEIHESISYLGIDVSDSGEALYVYKRILSRHLFPYKKLIVDIGANDGLMSSNSFNFIQWGWDAMLVEPVQQQIEMAKQNAKRFRDPYRDNKQNVQYIQAVIGTIDGSIDFALTNDVVSMENHIIKTNRPMAGNVKGVTKVKSMRVETFVKTYNIPRMFGILSIDAEGIGDEVLHQFMEYNMRPAYIIYESLHNRENIYDTERYMKSFGYVSMSKLGWNHIFEHRP
ncbi:unnamed protein product, partial [Owenia fusiformis]